MFWTKMDSVGPRSRGFQANWGHHFHGPQFATESKLGPWAQYATQEKAGIFKWTIGPLAFT